MEIKKIDFSKLLEIKKQLSIKNRETIMLYVNAINHHTSIGDDASVEMYKSKLHGYLCCLRDSELISMKQFEDIVFKSNIVF